MFNRFKTLLTPPNFPDDEINLMARLLYALFALVIVVSLVLTMPLAWLIPSGGLSIAAQGMAGILICVFLYFLVRKGIVLPVAHLLVWLFWGLNTMTVITSGGIESNAFGNYMVIIFAAGLLLGPGIGAGITLMCAFVGVGVVLAEQNHALPPSIVAQTPFTLLFSHIILFAMVVILQGIAGRMIRQALNRARTSEEKYRSLLESIPTITYINSLAPGNPTTYVSPQVSDLLDYTQEIFLEDPLLWTKLIHPDDQARVSTENARTNETGMPFTIDYRIFTKDGQVIWVHDEAVLVKDKRGEPQYWLGIWTNITELKQTETALTQERDLLQALMNNIPDMIYFKDTASRFVRINATHAQFLGAMEPDKAIGKTDFDFHTVQLAQAFFEEEQEMMRTGKPIIDHLEFTPMPDGESCWISASKVPIRNHEHQIIGMVGISRNVTERELIRQTLLKQTNQLSTVAKVSTAVSTILNPDELLHNIVDVTKDNFALYHAHVYLLSDDGQTLIVKAGSGETGQKMQLEHWQIPFHHPKSIVARVARLRHGALINNVEASENFLPNPLLAETRSELAVPMLVGEQLLGVFDLQKDILSGFEEEDLPVFTILAQQIAIALQNAQRYELAQKEIAERKRIEQALHQLNLELEERVHERTIQLQAANQELEAFSYTVSHDLRAPVRAMAGFSSILLEEYAHLLPVDAQQHLQYVRIGAERMGQLVDGLLTFTRLGRQGIAQLDVNVSSLVNQTFNALIEKQLGRKIHFSIGELPNCQGDPALLRQVFSILLENALKYSQSEPETNIYVDAYRQNDETVYFVKDNGIGFDMQYAHKLFGVFQQLHLPGEYEGTGLGLALAKRIIEKHGGEIWVEAAPGKGATFFFTLAPGN